MFYITYKDRSGKTRKISTEEFKVEYECPECGSIEEAYSSGADFPCTACEERRDKAIKLACQRAMAIYKEEQENARLRTVQRLRQQCTVDPTEVFIHSDASVQL